MPKGTVVGRQVGGLPIVRYRLGKAVQVNLCKATKFITAGEVGVTSDGFAAVEDGARIVVKIELGNPSVEVGLVKMRLVVDDKVSGNRNKCKAQHDVIPRQFVPVGMLGGRIQNICHGNGTAQMRITQDLQRYAVEQRGIELEDRPQGQDHGDDLVSGGAEDLVL